MVFDLEFPMKSYRLKLKVYDKDLISFDDFIGEVVMDFEEYAKLAYDS